MPASLSPRVAEKVQNIKILQNNIPLHSDKDLKSKNIKRKQVLY